MDIKLISPRNYRHPAFTLIELIVAIFIMTIMATVIYFSMATALESWEETRSHLSLQKVITQLIDEIIGNQFHYGLKDSIEIFSAEPHSIEFIPPWTDDTHTVSEPEYIYTLNRKLKPGSGIPIAEVELSETNRHQVVPCQVIEMEDNDQTKVRLGVPLPEGIPLRFIFLPEKNQPDVITKLWWDSQSREVYISDQDGTRNLSENLLGVKISNLTFRYYDNANNILNKGGAIEEKDLNLITGLEIILEASLEAYKETLVNFVNLPNAPRRSGYLTLHEGTRVIVPDSGHIHSLLLTNFSGISNDDNLEIEFIPEHGKTWKLIIHFSRYGSHPPRIERYSIEYPPSQEIYSESPKIEASVGLDLLTLGPNGLYDYDLDTDIADIVSLKGPVTMHVSQMDIEGAALFIRP
ncbi:MAG: prepilin-type N-terminal cleavage/methylation domain-containing protein [Candidatus Omnitrophica bacterium]|nr:prepilin-type N-terminal cleavage/methylation domain-containing protein [Candidatus Omnitrophota bacterium]